MVKRVLTDWATSRAWVTALLNWVDDRLHPLVKELAGRGQIDFFAAAVEELGI